MKNTAKWVADAILTFSLSLSVSIPIEMAHADVAPGTPNVSTATTPAVSTERTPTSILNPFVSCKGMNPMYQRTYDKLCKGTNDKTCPPNAYPLPERGWLSAVGSPEDAKKKAEMLTGFGNWIQDRAEFNKDVNDIVIHCARPGDASKKWFDQKAAQAQTSDKDLYNYAKCDEVMNGRHVESMGTVQKGLKENIAELGREMRIELEIMRRTGGALYKTGRATYDNKTLQSMNIMAKNPGEQIPLNDVEKDEVEVRMIADKAMVLRNFETQANEKWKPMIQKMKSRGDDPERVIANDPSLPLEVLSLYRDNKDNLNGRWIVNGPNTVRDSLPTILRDGQRKLFVDHLKNYADIIHKLPILTYLGNRNPGNEDIARAAELVQANAKSELDSVNTAMRLAAREKMNSGRATRSVTNEDKVNALIKLFDFGPSTVDAYLAEHPEQCMSAIALSNYLATKKAEKWGVGIAAIAIASGGASATVAPALASAMGGSWLASVGASTIVGSSIGIPVTKVLVSNYRDAEAKAHGVVGGTPTLSRGRMQATALGDSSAALQARSAAAFGILTSIMPGIVAERGAAASGQLRRLLTERGMSSAAAAQVVSDLKSGVPFKVNAAISTIAGKVEIDAAQFAKTQNLITRATRLSRLNNTIADRERYEDLIRKFTADTQAAAVQKQQSIVDTATAMLNKIDTAKLGPGGRAEAPMTVLAGARLGWDADQIVNAVTTWKDDTGKALSGLTDILDGASTRMKLPQYQTMVEHGDIAGARTAAYQDELAAAVNRIRPNATAAEKQEMVAKALGCMMRPK